MYISRLETGYVHGLERQLPWRWWNYDLRYRVCEGVHCGDCGHVIPGTRSGKGHQPGNFGHVNLISVSGRIVTVETLDM